MVKASYSLLFFYCRVYFVLFFELDFITTVYKNLATYLAEITTIQQIGAGIFYCKLRKKERDNKNKKFNLVILPFYLDILDLKL